MKKTFSILAVLLLLLVASGFSFAESTSEEELDVVTVMPRGPVYQHAIFVDFCSGTIAQAFYGNFSTTYRITNITSPIPMKEWGSDLGSYYKYKYIDSEGYEIIPFDDGYEYVEYAYENRACGLYGS